MKSGTGDHKLIKDTVPAVLRSAVCHRGVCTKPSPVQGQFRNTAAGGHTAAPANGQRPAQATGTHLFAYAG